MLNKISNNQLTLTGLSLIGFIWLGLRMYWIEETELVLNRFLLIEQFHFSNSTGTTVLAVILMVACFLISFRTIRKYRFLERNASTMVFFFLIGLMIFPNLWVELSTGLASIVALLSLQFSLEVHHQKVVLPQLFFSSVMVGIASLLFYPFIFLLLPIFLAISLFRSFELRNYLMVFIGFLLPIFYYIVVSYLLDEPLKLEGFQSVGMNMEKEIGKKIPFVILLSMALIGGLKVLSERSKFIVRQRNQLTIIFCFAAILLILSFLTSFDQLIVPLLAMMSFFITYYYETIKKKWIADLFLIGLIATFFLLK